MYSREMKTYVYTKVCPQMLIAALFILVKKWKQSECPSTDEWINQMWSMHTQEYHSAIKMNDILITYNNVNEP